MAVTHAICYDFAVVTTWSLLRLGLCLDLTVVMTWPLLWLGRCYDLAVVMTWPLLWFGRCYDLALTRDRWRCPGQLPLNVLDPGRRRENCPWIILEVQKPSAWSFGNLSVNRPVDQGQQSQCYTLLEKFWRYLLMTLLPRCMWRKVLSNRGNWSKSSHTEHSVNS